MCITFVKIVLLINSQLIAQCLGTASTTEGTGIQWPNHDISTLKLLQIVHRHGDRNPIAFSPNDPYQSSEYWREGLGELTAAGKYRMYKLGQTLRKEYHNYLGDDYSPREVYVRSSLSHRCIESVSSLLAGAYPPKHRDWQWANGTDPLLGQHWQPFPIETFMPKRDDIVLRQDKYCPAVDREREAIYRSPDVQNYLKNRTVMFDRLSQVVGHPLDSIKRCNELHTGLEIEMSRGLYWTHVWTKEEQLAIVEQLRDVHRYAYLINWNSTVIRRLRAGGLVGELVKNLRSVISGQNKRKAYVYSTHDSMLAALMTALSVFDGELPLFGSTLLLELHRNSSTEEYFVRIFYIRDTTSGVVSALRFGDCGDKEDCPLVEFLRSTEPLIYEKFRKECKQFADRQTYDENIYFIR